MGAIVAGGLVVAAAVISLAAAHVFAPPGSTAVSDQPSVKGKAIVVWPEQPPAEAAAARAKALPVDAVQVELDALAQRTLELETHMPNGGPAERATFAAELQQLDVEVQSLERELYRVTEPRRKELDHE